MPNYLLIVSYDGSKFHGYQKQGDLRTVELEMDKAIEKVFQAQIRSFPSGRTDQGVHAIGQTVGFVSSLVMKPDAVVRALNSFLPLDIQVKSACIMKENFHPRHQAKRKEYRYFLKRSVCTPFEVNYMGSYPYPLDIDLMVKSSQDFIGTHDFRGFGKVEIEGKPTIKTIYDVKVIDHQDRIEFRFIGNSFLKYSVRSMVGTLVAIGAHKRKENVIKEIFATGNRSLAGKTIEPQGLYLWEVIYDGGEVNA